MQLTYSNLSWNQMEHDFLWRAIFKDFNKDNRDKKFINPWLQLAVEEFRVSPILLGPDLHEYCNGTKKTAYMVLLVDDRSGNLHYRQDIFFESLQSKLVTGRDDIEMDDLEPLFKENKLQTTYSVWADRQKELKPIEPPNIIWVEELKRLSPLFCLNLSIPGQLLLQQLFQKPHRRKTRSIFKDGKGSEIVGFKWME
ncbi:hypothetical protein K469DRAFT_752833 [Zopfia rhizophila CBS 207.26]|uniref:Uncharacterized protein n=1 Tax=Zopfia rhizophila CBS 207.26 TaxID=1314779 RepID=A0A6A6DP71_9PEZI|nr:hypothetical protein K469DRAFT_752833 [Zopfia rhizophila CBS 207.26]